MFGDMTPEEIEAEQERLNNPKRNKWLGRLVEIYRLDEGPPFIPGLYDEEGTA